MVAISNFKLVLGHGMLNLWIDSVQKAGAKPWMVLAIDEDLYHHLTSRKLPVFLIKQEIAEAQQGTGSNHAVSALKFGILAEFIKLGWSVLLSDVDVVTLSNPFEHLYRDRDIEGVTLYEAGASRVQILKSVSLATYNLCTVSLDLPAHCFLGLSMKQMFTCRHDRWLR